MDAIVGESYVSGAHTDRNNTVSDEGGSSNKNTRKNNSRTNRRQPQSTTYGVSVSQSSVFRKIECILYSFRLFICLFKTFWWSREWMNGIQMLAMPMR